MNDSTKTTDVYIGGLPNWQASNLISFRELIKRAEPTITEEIKWGVPVFIYRSKMIFSMAAFKEHTKYNFIQNGALLSDTQGVFNNGLDSKKSRSIDLREGEAIDAKQLEGLITEAIKLGNA